jgi:hypothetical protein
MRLITWNCHHADVEQRLQLLRPLGPDPVTLQECRRPVLPFSEAIWGGTREVHGIAVALRSVWRGSAWTSHPRRSRSSSMVQRAFCSSPSRLFPSTRSLLVTGSARRQMDAKGCVTRLNSHSPLQAPVAHGRSKHELNMNSSHNRLSSSLHLQIPGAMHHAPSQIDPAGATCHAHCHANALPREN